MENNTNNILPSILLDLFSLRILFDFVYCVPSFFLSYWSLLRCQFQLSDNYEFTKSEQKNRNSELKTMSLSEHEEAEDGDLLLGQEVKMVIERLGIDHSLEGEELEKKWGSEDICGLFDQEEPSLEEAREAFDVFDQNKDGFIDAGELQRVLSGLGLMKQQGLSEVQACRKMIKVFDQNGDGKIDFNEFVNFLLNGF